MEKMVKQRLMNFLETKNLIVNYQFGFQKSRSTLDPLTHLEYAIRDTIIWDKYLIVVFLDIEKAFDMVWTYGLLQELYDLGLRGNLPNFIKNFLSNRTIQVKIEAYISSKFNLENGLPQGSIISVALFLIAINKMFKNCTETDNRLFCDDGCFWSQHTDLDIAETKIQDTLNKLTKWSKETGLKFSTQKSVYCIFTHKNTKNLNLTLYNDRLPRSYKIKYLGMTLDHRLNWKAHIEHLKEKSQQRLAILRCVSKRKWGADRKTLRTLYLSLIQSPINYGSFLYGAAGGEDLKKLNRIQYAGIRIINGALRPTRTTMLEIEAHIQPLDLRRHFLGLSYLGRSARLEKSITSEIYANHYNFQFFDNINKPLPYIGIAQKIINDININLGEIAQLKPNYLYNPFKAHTNFYMHHSNKKNLLPEEAKSQFIQMLSQYDRYIPVFTDGSVKQQITSCAVVIKNRNYLYRLPNNTSIFTAELYAISMAIDKINLDQDQQYLICSDSLSSLQTLKSGLDNSLAHTIMEKLETTNKTIKFEYVPSHKEIPGNDKADMMAKLALNLNEINQIPLEYSDFKNTIKKHLNRKWQENWDQANSFPNRPSHLYPIKTVIKDWPSINKNTREQEIILARLRLGACMFNKKHIIDKQPHPECQLCHVELDVQHVLIECPEYNNQRIPIVEHLRKENLPLNLVSILNEEFPHNKIYQYLENINYISKI